MDAFKDIFDLLPCGELDVAGLASVECLSQLGSDET
jgi:hypothetical protein